MKKLKYKITLGTGDLSEGDAERVVIKDDRTLLTLKSQHAPLAATLTKGEITVFKSEDKSDSKVFPIEAGFFRVKDGLCSITILH